MRVTLFVGLQQLACAWGNSLLTLHLYPRACVSLLALYSSQARDQRCTDPEAFCKDVNEAIQRARLGEAQAGELLARIFRLCLKYEVGWRYQLRDLSHFVFSFHVVFNTTCNLKIVIAGESQDVVLVCLVFCRNLKFCFVEIRHRSSHLHITIGDLHQHINVFPFPYFFQHSVQRKRSPKSLEKSEK